MSEWIKITERLPEDGTEVLIYGEDLYTCLAHFWGGEWSADGVIYGKTVTHWMALPSPIGKKRWVVSRSKGIETHQLK